MSIAKKAKTKAKEHGIDAGYWGDFERKDRFYHLKGDGAPVARILKSKNISWYDPDLGFEREVMYTTNQTTPFVDEFKTKPKIGHIIVRDGVMKVPKEKTVLQWFLSYLSTEKGVVYEEQDAVKEATNELDVMDLGFEAEQLARSLDINALEAIVRTVPGTDVDTMTSSEIKRDAIVLSRNNPALFIELANDENLEIRNLGIKAERAGIISLSQDQRTFHWAETGRELCKVPFNERPFSALAAWFKTDDGFDVFKTVEAKLK